MKSVTNMGSSTCVYAVSSSLTEQVLRPVGWWMYKNRGVARIGDQGDLIIIQE